MISAPLVMISYSWDDADAAELLHEEFALRGMAVAHDRCTFSTGSRIAANMSNETTKCDGFVAYFTPSSLYENRSAGEPRPVIDDEFLPIMDRLASSSVGDALAAPVVVALTHGLGDPRTEAPERVRKASGRDISSLWTPIVLNQTTDAITQPEAAAVAGSVCDALLTRSLRDNHQGSLDLAVTTRGTGQAGLGMTVDATSTLGGTDPHPGDPTDWSRLATALSDVERSVASATPNRNLRILPKAHLSAALLTGRTFHQAAGWQLTLPGRLGDVRLSDESNPDLRVSRDVGSRGGDIAVEIDLIGVQVSAIAARTLAGTPTAVASRLIVQRESTGDMPPAAISTAARITAEAIREAVFDRDPKLVHVFCASPVEFAVLVGHQLTSLHTPVQLYERSGDRYEPSVRMS